MSEPEREIKGIWIYGASSVLGDVKYKMSKSEHYLERVRNEWAAMDDPWFVPADLIDYLIEEEIWKAGQLDNVECRPGREEWPSRWKGLQEPKK